ncbi:hypothetical protein ACSBR2_011959 [Camellia fascicularis]
MIELVSLASLQSVIGLEGAVWLVKAHQRSRFDNLNHSICRTRRVLYAGGYITLPKSPNSSIPMDYTCAFVAFGFSPMTNQFEVVWSVHPKVLDPVIGLQANRDYDEEEIYTLGEGSEQFRAILKPSEFDCPDKEFSHYVHVGVLRGCLSLCDVSTVKNEVAIWVTQDYGVKESWSKGFAVKDMIYNGKYPNYYKPIIILRSGQVLMIVDDEALVLCDLAKRHHKSVQISRIRSGSAFHGIGHVPILVSLKDVAKGENLKIWFILIRNDKEVMLQAAKKRLSIA